MKNNTNEFAMINAVMDCVNAMKKNDFRELNFQKWRIVNFYGADFKTAYTQKKFSQLLKKYRWSENVLNHDFYKTIRYLAKVLFWRDYDIKFCIE